MAFLGFAAIRRYKLTPHTVAIRHDSELLVPFMSFSLLHSDGCILLFTVYAFMKKINRCSRCCCCGLVVVVMLMMIIMTMMIYRNLTRSTPPCYHSMTNMEYEKEQDTNTLTHMKHMSGPILLFTVYASIKK